MRNTSARLSLLLAASLAATGALAQSNPIARQAAEPAQSQEFKLEGFFRPTPDGDPSLTKYRPDPPPQQVAARAPTPPQAPEPIYMRAPDSNPASAPAAMEQARWTEEQLDRTERESERDRARAATMPQPVAPGAWDGTTSNANR
jgi:hypothetical protein